MKKLLKCKHCGYEDNMESEDEVYHKDLGVTCYWFKCPYCGDTFMKCYDDN